MTLQAGVFDALVLTWPPVLLLVTQIVFCICCHLVGLFYTLYWILMFLLLCYSCIDWNTYSTAWPCAGPWRPCCWLDVDVDVFVMAGSFRDGVEHYQFTLLCFCDLQCCPQHYQKGEAMFSFLSKFLSTWPQKQCGCYLKGLCSFSDWHSLKEMMRKLVHIILDNLFKGEASNLAW